MCVRRTRIIAALAEHAEPRFNAARGERVDQATRLRIRADPSDDAREIDAAPLQRVELARVRDRCVDHRLRRQPREPRRAIDAVGDEHHAACIARPRPRATTSSYETPRLMSSSSTVSPSAQSSASRKRRQTRIDAMATFVLKLKRQQLRHIEVSDERADARRRALDLDRRASAQVHRPRVCEMSTSRNAPGADGSVLLECRDRVLGKAAARSAAMRGDTAVNSPRAGNRNTPAVLRRRLRARRLARSAQCRRRVASRQHQRRRNQRALHARCWFRNAIVRPSASCFAASS